MSDQTPDYPLIESAAYRLQAASGRHLADITGQAVDAGELSLADLQISAETLRAQAAVAPRRSNTRRHSMGQEWRVLGACPSHSSPP